MLQPAEVEVGDELYQAGSISGLNLEKGWDRDDCQEISATMRSKGMKDLGHIPLSGALRRTLRGWIGRHHGR
jgi:hypothetical protein